MLSLGTLPLRGELALWHPLDDLHVAPRMPFRSAPEVEAIYVGDELAGYSFRASGEQPTTWRELGDAGTDADRFFLVEVEQIELVIRWLNDIALDFENLGGERDLEVAEYENGARVVVLRSPDGNARIFGGFSPDGALTSAFFEA